MSSRKWLGGFSVVAALGAGVLATGVAAAGAGAAVGAAGSGSASGVTATQQLARWQSPACAAAPLGYSTCLVHVVHVVHGLSAGAGNGREYRGASASSPTGLSPSTIATAYGFATTGGQGRTIAIVDAYGDSTITTDLDAFSTKYGLPTCTSADGCFAKVNQTGGVSTLRTHTSGWALETSLDVEWAHALAPNARILLVEASSNSDTNLFTAVSYAAANAQYVSMSWGGTEFSGESAFDPTLSVAGVSYFAATGDKASEVSYPATSPDVVAVGGTTLTVTSATSAWKAEAGWSTGGGGCSVYETATHAQAAYPSYDQTGATCAGRRAVPDVSLDANPSTGVAVYDTVSYRGWVQVGGTSASTVMIAAHAAETGQQVNATFVYGSAIKVYNVTTGSNGHPCEKGFNLCTGLGSWNTAVGTSGSGSGAGGAGSFSFTSSAQTLTAGKASGAMTVGLSAPAPTAGLTVSVSSTSPTGEFSESPGGPFASSPMPVRLASGATQLPAFYYEDTKAGTPTLTASATGWTSGSQAQTVVAGALAKVTVSPTSAIVRTGGSQSFSATGYDGYTNPLAVSPTWSSTVAGSFSPVTGATTTFTAGQTAAGGTITATAGATKGSATITVTPSPVLAVTVTAGATATGKHHRSYSTALTVHVTASGAAVRGATVTLTVYSGSCTGTGSPVSSGTGTTGSGGTVRFTFSTGTTGSYCAKASASASGYTSGVASTSFSVPSAAPRVAQSAVPFSRLT